MSLTCWREMMAQNEDADQQLTLRDGNFGAVAETRLGSNQQLREHTNFDISGGVFEATHFGPQTFNLTKKEGIVDGNFEGCNLGTQNIQQNIQNIYVTNKGDEASLKTTCNPFKPKQDIQEQAKDKAQLSDSIWMFCDKKLCKQGHVYEGEETSGVYGPQPIAVKFLPFNKRNIEEAKILRKLTHHPHVVSIIHSDIYAGPVKYMYIAMERCHTQNLYEHVKSNKEYMFDPHIAMSQAKQLVKGIHHIHKNSIIHRDLKPDNVLFSLDGKTIKVADFGLSKELKAGRSQTAQSCLRVGTDGYRAPETYNSDTISQQADIFSLGLVIYFIWSKGGHPYGDDPDDWNSNIKRNNGRSLDGISTLACEKAKELLDWTLQFEPTQRPNAKQILEHACFGRKDSSSRKESEGEAKAESDISLVMGEDIFEFMKMHHDVKNILQSCNATKDDQSQLVTITFHSSATIEDTNILEELHETILKSTVEQPHDKENPAELNYAIGQVQKSQPGVMITNIPKLSKVRFIGTTHHDVETARRLFVAALDRSWMLSLTTPCQGADGKLFSCSCSCTKLKVSVIVGDISMQSADAVVNSTNSLLKDERVGVAGAIFRVGGDAFRKECNDLLSKRNFRRLDIGEVVHTTACGDLRCKKVIHVYGPGWAMFGRTDQTRSCEIIMKQLCWDVLMYADALKAETVAVPAISTGYQGVPRHTFCAGIVDAIERYNQNLKARKQVGGLKEINIISIYPNEASEIANHFKQWQSGHVSMK